MKRIIKRIKQKKNLVQKKNQKKKKNKDKKEKGKLSIKITTKKMKNTGSTNTVESVNIRLSAYPLYEFVSYFPCIVLLFIFFIKFQLFIIVFRLYT